MRFRRTVTGVALTTLSAGLLATIPLSAAQAVSADLVISQVYGGGGNTGAPYTHDFVEIYNRGPLPASTAGLSIQYGSATGTGNIGANSGQLTELPALTVPSGGYLLVQEGAGAGSGSALPAADVVDPTPIGMSGTEGKVALVRGTDGLGCNGGSAPCSDTQRASIIDLLGYGGANFAEGSAAPRLSNTTAALRAAGG
ncbi:MAG: hypothetical protein AVDCRST_MAG57-361, partial [uncultured Blastococcus sp.]